MWPMRLYTMSKYHNLDLSKCKDHSVCVRASDGPSTFEVTMHYVRVGSDIILTRVSGPAVILERDGDIINVYMTNGRIRGITGSCESDGTILNITTEFITNGAISVEVCYPDGCWHHDSCFDADKLANKINDTAEHIIAHPTSSDSHVVSLVKSAFENIAM